MKYVYFASYSFIRNGAIGFGNLEYTTPRPITTIEQVSRIGTMVTQQREADQVAILSFQLLRTEEEV